MVTTRTCISIDVGPESRQHRPSSNQLGKRPQLLLDRSSNIMVYASSSRILCRAFPQYTRAIRRLLLRIKFLDRLSVIALFLSVLLAYILTFVPPSDFGAYDDNNSISHPTLDTVHNGSQVKVPTWSPIYQTNHTISPKATIQMHRRFHRKRKAHNDVPIVTNKVNNSPIPEVPSTATSPKKPTYDHHFETDLIKSQVDLRKLPQPSWYHNKQLEEFRPLAFRTTGIRLISLNNACYCTHRNKFILPNPRTYGTKSSNARSVQRMPSFLFRYGAAQGVSWKSARHILAFSNQKTVFVPGTTVLWRGRALDMKEDHIHRALIPIRSVLDIIRQSTPRSKLHVAAEKFGTSTDDNPNIVTLQEYYLGTSITLKRIALSQLRPRLLCFHRVIALGSEYDNHAASTEVYDHVKKLVEVAESGKLRAPLIRACTDHAANTRNIWIIHRQAARSSYESIDNLSQVEMAINHELLHLNLAEKVSLRVIQAPNTPCPPGTAREGCYDLHCNEVGTVSKGCFRNASPLREAQIYNNMTFVITTSGLITESFPYLPRGSHIIEIVPYGFLDPTYERAAHDGHLVYHRVRGKLSENEQLKFYQRFGDVAATVESCWADLECRAARMKTKTLVDLHHFRSALKKAMFVWRAACAKDSPHYEKEIKLRKQHESI